MSTSARHLRPAAVVIATAAIALPMQGSAQRGSATAAARGWLPREVHAITSVTPAQRTAAVATLDAIERIVKQVPELATPQGFEIVPIVAGGARRRDADENDVPNTVIEYSLALAFYAPSRAAAGEGRSCLVATVNPRQHGTMRDRRGRLIYIEGDRGKPSTNPTISDSRVPNATVVYGELWNVPRERSGVEVMFARAGDLPWTPVSRDAFYEAALIDLEGVNGEKLAAVRDSLAKTPYQEWMDQAAQRRKERETTLAQLAGIMPAAEIEKTRQALEASERDVTARLKQDEEQHRQRNGDALRMAAALPAKIRAELAAMTPAERAMPAYINNALDQGPVATGSRLTTNESPPAWRVLTPNFEFWRTRRSPVEVHSLNVQISISGTCLTPNIQQALWRTYHSLDWAALKALVEQPG
jgi:hypothetical protein